MKKLAYAVAILVVLAAMFVYFRWSSAIHQPLQYSHPQHVNARIDCAACHLDRDTLPAVGSCKSCHPDMSLPGSVRWVRVYRVAPDIIFHHAGHTRAPCNQCHPQFTSATRWVHESRFTMDFCMKCHEQTGASNQCGVCHKNRR